MIETQNKFPVLWIYIALTLATFSVFYQVRYCDFVNYDDDKYVTENSHVTIGLTRENIIWAFTTGHAANWHPLTWLSHMLDCQLFRLNPAGHHLTNLLFHIINTLLLFAVLRQMTGAVWQCTFVAAIFALHPLHVESVAWVSERKDVLSTMFLLLAMIAYVRYARHSNVTRYLLTLVLFALGLMAKPMLVTLPFVLLLLDYWPLERLERKNLHRRILEKFPFLILAAVSSVITFFVQLGGGAVMDIEKISFLSRINNAFLSYLTYIIKLFVPTHLAVFYPHFVDMMSTWKIMASILLLVIASILVIWLAIKHKYLFVGWFWYLGTLIPVIGLVQVGSQSLADRYTYVPLIGLFIIAAWGFPSLFKKSPAKKALTAFAALIILAAFSVCTFLQLGYWRNSTTLFEHALAVTENNYVAHYSLGNALFRQGKIEQAMVQNYEALRINPDCLPARTALGVALTTIGRLDDAIEQFNYVIKSKPDFAEVYYDLGVALTTQGKYEDAIQSYRKALELNPDYAQAYNSIGIAFSFLGKFEEAASSYRKALQLQPDYAEAHNNFGTVLSAQNKLDEAVGQFSEALRLNPNSVNAITNLGYAVARSGNLEKGIAYLSEAILLNPGLCEAHYYMALVLAQKGEMDEAVKHAVTARELAVSAGNKQLADQIREFLDLHKANQAQIESGSKPTK